MWFVRAKRNKTIITKLPVPDGKESAERIVQTLQGYGWEDVKAFWSESK